MSVKPYPEYKESGVAWLGGVPLGWEVRGIKLAASTSGGAGFPHEFQGSEDEAVPFHKVSALATADSDGVIRTTQDTVSHVTAGLLHATVFPAGSLVLAKIGAALLLGRIRSVDRPFCIDNNMLAVIPKDQTDARFLYYALQIVDFNQIVNPGAVPSLDMTAFRDYSLGFPDILEQSIIAAFLDRETAEIDAFIADQVELIALLNERRTATITQAVTKGLYPKARMKDSGVEWVGAVPAHWPISKIGLHYEVVLGKMLDGAKEAPSGARMLPYVRAGNIQDAGLDLSDVNEMAYTAYEAERLNLLAKDLLVVEGGSVGTVHYLSEAMDGWSFQKTVNRVRSLGSADTKYLGHLIRMLRDSDVFEVICNGSTIMHLTAEKLRALLIPVPPVEEQCSIAAFIDRETAEIDATIAEASDAIALSKERRAAVISAAVTGKIDVRGALTPATTKVEIESVGVA